MLTGFIVGINNIYLSSSNGRLLIVDVETGNTQKVLDGDLDGFIEESLKRGF